MVFPRTIPQAEALDTFLSSKNSDIKLMVALDVPVDELVKRLLLRGKDSGRADDTDETIIQNRIRVYNEQTAIVADFYDAREKFSKIDGVGSIDEISQRLYDAIDTVVVA
jgi:adenylate kinase